MYVLLYMLFDVWIYSFGILFIWAEAFFDVWIYSFGILFIWAEAFGL